MRLLVPGWGGIASTKWIVRLEVIDHPFAGPFNTESYVVINEDGTIIRPVREMPEIRDHLTRADASSPLASSW